MSVLGAGVAEHAAAATQPVLLEPAGSQTFSSVMQTFGERVAVARTRSEGGARSASGVLSAAASLVGLRFERRPQSQQPVEQERFNELTLMDQNLWADTRSNRSNAQNFVVQVAAREGELNANDIDDAHHRSASEVGFQVIPKTPQHQHPRCRMVPTQTPPRCMTREGLRKNKFPRPACPRPRALVRTGIPQHLHRQHSFAFASLRPNSQPDDDKLQMQQ